MIETLKRICELQPNYSSENTPAMQERGRLVRQVLPSEFRRFEARLRQALGRFGDDMGIQASDGIGRKTEAPWVRIFAKSMSPAPTNGFYVVVHFASDGSAVFVTVGCGSTIWQNGDLKAVSDDELNWRTNWARAVVLERFGTLSPFTDEIVLGAKAPLPRTFEKATALAKRIAVTSLDDKEFEDLLILASERLREVYEAQRVGRDLTASDAAEIELEAISRPTDRQRAGQGLRLSAEERRAIELRAMELAEAWLTAEGYAVKDKSRTASFDFEATGALGTLKIEVKGTTSDRDEAIFMTKNEVDLHMRERGQTGLIIVSNIRLEKSGAKTKASGGRVYADIGWDIEGWELLPMSFKVTRSVKT